MRPLRFRFLHLGKPPAPQEKQHVTEPGGRWRPWLGRQPWGRPPSPSRSSLRGPLPSQPPAMPPALTRPRPEMTQVAARPRPAPERQTRPRALRPPPEVHPAGLPVAPGPLGSEALGCPPASSDGLGTESREGLRPQARERSLQLLPKGGLALRPLGPAVERPPASPQGRPRALLTAALLLCHRGAAVGSLAPWPWVPGRCCKHREPRENQGWTAVKALKAGSAQGASQSAQETPVWSRAHPAHGWAEKKGAPRKLSLTFRVAHQAEDPSLGPSIS